MKINLIKGLFIIVCLVTLSGCQTTATTSEENGQNDLLKVVATNSIIADMAKEVGGDHIELHSIVPVGIDPHQYEPLPEDIQKASDAEVVLYNGLNLETGNGWFEKLMTTASKKENQDYFVVSKNVTPIYLTSEGNTNKENPHAWLDITNGIAYIEEISRVLIEKDPENQKAYQSNTEKYVEKLQELDQSAKQKFADIPDEKKLLVTSEGAFTYFSKAYDLTAAYIWEINTDSQGTPEQMKVIIDKVRGSEVASLFVETSVDKRSMERLAQETSLEIYSNLFTDSVAEEGQDGDSYYDMMKWNLDKIHEGLVK